MVKYVCVSPIRKCIFLFRISGELEEINDVRTVLPDEVNKISIYDVVYPLPGHAIRYPENEIAKWYEEVLREYGIFDLSGKNK